MTFLNRDKISATNSADFSVRAQCPLDGRAIIRQIYNFSRKKHRTVRRRWPKQFDRIFRSDRAWRAIFVCTFHEMISRCPIAMTIQQRADDAAIQDSIKSFVFFLRFPLGDHFAVFWKASDVQPVRVRRAATETNIVRRIFFLKRLGFFHEK